MINLLRSRCHNIVSSNLKKHARPTIKKTQCTIGAQLKSVQSFNFSNVPRSSLDLSDKEHKLIKVNAGNIDSILYVKNNQSTQQEVIDSYDQFEELARESSRTEFISPPWI